MGMFLGSQPYLSAIRLECFVETMGRDGGRCGGRIEEHEKLGKGDGSKGENQEEETIQVIRGRKVAMPRQPALKG